MFQWFIRAHGVIRRIVHNRSRLEGVVFQLIFGIHSDPFVWQSPVFFKQRIESALFMNPSAVPANSPITVGLGSVASVLCQANL